MQSIPSVQMEMSLVHKPLLWHVRVARRVDDLPADWDSLNIPFGTMRWLRLSERIVKDFRPIFVVLKNAAGHTVGGAVAHLTTHTGVTLTNKFGQWLVHALLSTFPLLICQIPGWASGGLALPTDGPAKQAEALRLIRAALLREASASRAAFLVFGRLNPAQSALAHSTNQLGMVSMDAETVLHITWPDFETYTASLSASMRKDMRRHDNRARDLGLRIEHTREFAQHSERLLELIQAVEGKHGSADSQIYRRDLFETLEQSLSDKSVMLLARIGDQVVGCGLLLEDQGVLRLAFLGRDTNLKYVYFQLFYEAIRHAITSHCRVVRAGTGAYDFKARLGFQNEPTFIAFTSPLPLLRWLGMRLSQSVQNTTTTVTHAE